MGKINIVTKEIGQITVHIIECDVKDFIILRPRQQDNARLISPMTLQLGTAPRYLYLDSSVKNEEVLAAIASLNKEYPLTGETDMMTDISLDAAIEALNHRADST